MRCLHTAFVTEDGQPRTTPRRPAFVPMPQWSLVHGEPRAPLGTWPTPVHRMDHTSQALGIDVWVKREDRAGAWGGNKVRKLEFWLARPEVWRTRRVVVSGAGGSTWTAAAALHARKHGLDVVVALAGAIPEERHRLYSELGVDVVHHSNLNALPLVVAKARLAAGRRAVLLPMGGSGWPGDLGSYLCGSELVDGFDSAVIPRPRSIFVAAGTSGTAAGIAAALAHRRESCAVTAVRVTPRQFGTARVVKRRARKVLRRMDRERGSAPLAVVGSDAFFGEGYGRPGPGVDEAIEMAERDGVELEPTYTAKAFAALIAHARAGAVGPLLFVHTAAGPMPSS